MFEGWIGGLGLYTMKRWGVYLGRMRALRDARRGAILNSDPPFGGE